MTDAVAWGSQPCPQQAVRSSEELLPDSGSSLRAELPWEEGAPSACFLSSSQQPLYFPGLCLGEFQLWEPGLKSGLALWPPGRRLTISFQGTEGCLSWCTLVSVTKLL